MKEILQSTIEQLRFHVMKNLELVRENEREIKEMLKEPVSAARAQVLSEKYDYSKRVLAENNDFINLQLSIINFIYKYKCVWDHEKELAVVSGIQTASLSRDECFQLTIDSKLQFDARHPFFNDDNFFDNLLDFFKEKEDYEKCNELVKLKK